jgi:hypothetical protein
MPSFYHMFFFIFVGHYVEFGAAVASTASAVTSCLVWCEMCALKITVKVFVLSHVLGVHVIHLF